MVLPVGLVAGANGHVSWHNQLHTRFNVVDDIINVKDPAYGAVGDGIANDTDALASAIAACPPGGTVFIPQGVYLSDPITVTKAIRFQGAGRWSTWLKQRLNSAGPFLNWELPTSAPGGVVRNYYGGAIDGLGIDLYGAASSTGIRLGTGGGWTIIRDFLVQGGTIGIDCRRINCWIEDGLVMDSGRFIVIDNDTGGQLTLRDLYLARNTAGTTTCAIDITHTATVSLASIFIHNVQVASAMGGGIGGTAYVEIGLRSVAPSERSAPIFMTQSYLDNIDGGPAMDLSNVSDINVGDCWFNAAAGPAVRIYGGKRLKFTDSQMFGGPPADPKTYEFTGGGTEGFISTGNHLPTGPAYHLPASGKPTQMFVDDHILNASADAHVTNDVAGLAVAMASSSGQRRFLQDVTLSGPISLKPLASGTATLVDGTATVPSTVIDDTATDVYFTHRVVSGTPGFLRLGGIVNGDSFTIVSSSPSDTSAVAWMIVRRVA